MSALVAMVLAQAATPAGAAPHAVTMPDWERRPSALDLGRFYPIGAMFRNQAGRATISCTVTAEGRLTDCSVVEEYPADAGFGEAALKMASFFKMRPMTHDGQPVGGGNIRIPLRFVLPEGGADLYSASLRCYGHVAAQADRDPASADAWTAAHAWAGQLIGMTYQSKGKLAVLEVSMSQARQSAVEETDVGARDRTARQCIDVVKRFQAKVEK